LYIDCVIYDYSFQAPPADKIEREHLNSLSIIELLDIIKDRGYNLEGIDVRNKRRLIRLVETAGAVPAKQPLRENTIIIGLDVPRESLKDRIKERTESMIQAGLKEEVKTIVDKYGWDIEGLKGIGYSEWKPYFTDGASLEETKLRIQRDTLQLAKRQRTWFKRNKSIHWMSVPVNRQDLVDIVTPLLYK
jgi:tRNA dimethylallyltransferase